MIFPESARPSTASVRRGLSGLHAYAFSEPCVPAHLAVHRHVPNSAFQLKVVCTICASRLGKNTPGLIALRVSSEHFRFKQILRQRSIPRKRTFGADVPLVPLPP